MSAPAAFKATYSDFKLVRSRKVVQVVCEIPLEQSEDFVKAFGMPNPTSETWVALARLQAGVAAAEEGRKERRRFNELPRSQQAALACNEPAFQVFIKEDVGGSVIGKTEYAAAICVREYCGVNSRSELNSDEAAARRWDELYSRYLGWRAAA